jgi:hypothetical protein
MEECMMMLKVAEVQDFYENEEVEVEQSLKFVQNKSEAALSCRIYASTKDGNSPHGDVFKEFLTIRVLEDHLLLEEGCIEEEVEPLEEWMIEDPRDEYCMEDTTQNKFVELYEELKFLEERIVSQTLHIQDVNSDLEEEDIVLKYNEEEVVKYGQ